MSLAQSAIPETRTERGIQIDARQAVIAGVVALTLFSTVFWDWLSKQVRYSLSHP